MSPIVDPTIWLPIFSQNPFHKIHLIITKGVFFSLPSPYSQKTPWLLQSSIYVRQIFRLLLLTQCIVSSPSDLSAFRLFSLIFSFFSFFTLIIFLPIAMLIKFISFRQWQYFLFFCQWKSFFIHSQWRYIFFFLFIFSIYTLLFFSNFFSTHIHIMFHFPFLSLGGLC